jgi:hypothetical protein
MIEVISFFFSKDIKKIKRLKGLKKEDDEAFSK